MALNCCTNVDSSSAPTSSRARWAIHFASSRVIAMGEPGLDAGHLERFALDRALHATAADALDADAGLVHGAVGAGDLDVLEVGPEHAPADAGDLPADAAEVFRLAAAGDLVAQDGFLPANVALHAHESVPFPKHSI